MKVIIDRFESNYAVLEYPDGTFKEIPANKLPEGCKEGDCLRIEKGTISIDILETDKRKAGIQKLMDDLME